MTTGELDPKHERSFVPQAQQWAYESLVFNDAFVVAMYTREAFEMVVFDRQSGAVMHTISPSRLSFPEECLPPYDEVDEDLNVPSGAPSIYGSHLMFACGVGDFCLAVVDLKSGTASFRPVGGLTLDYDFVSLGFFAPVVRLSHWNYLAFCVHVTGGPLLLWGFPKSREDQEHYDMIRTGEARKFDGASLWRASQPWSPRQSQCCR